MSDPLIELLAQVRLRPVRSSQYLRMYCPFHPNPSGRTLWVEHDTGYWGCFSTRCPQHRGGELWKLLVARGVDERVARGVTFRLDLKTREKHERPESLEDRDWAGKITEAHISVWGVDWYLASEVCGAVLRLGSYDPARPVSVWAPGCPALPGQVEHDYWGHLWYLLVHRGLQPHALDVMDAGFDRERCLWVLPVRGPKGDLRGAARRQCVEGAKYSLDGCVWKSDEDGYTFIEVKRGDVLFGWNELRARIMAGEPVVVVEGYADQLRLLGLGYCAVAMLGKTLSDAQVQLLASAPGPKVIWPDFDREGLNACRRTAVKLATTPRVRIVIDGCGVKDAGSSSVGRSIAARAIASAQPPAIWLSSVSNLLAHATA